MQLLDGHCYHTRNLDVVKPGRESNVLVPFLPARGLHKMQPLDLAGSRAVSVGIETRYGLDGKGLVSGLTAYPRSEGPPGVPGAVSLGALTSI